MSESGFKQQAAAVLRDRWQVPLALVAAVAAGATLYQLIPAPVAPDLQAVLADVAKLEQAGRTTDSADALANLLEMKPPLPSAEQAQIHEQLVELIFRQEEQRPAPNAGNLERVLEHIQAAEQLGAARTVQRRLQAGQAEEWLGHAGRAAASYRGALEIDPSPNERRTALRGLVRVLGTQSEGASGAGMDDTAQRDEAVEQLLADDGLDGPTACWALREGLTAALDENDTVRARLLLGRYGQRLASSDLKGFGEYLWANLLVHEGRIEEAAPVVHWVDQWLRDAGADGRAAESLRELTALNRWLLGRICLAQGQPEEALGAFEEALAFTRDKNITTDASGGRAAALAGLDRFEQSQEVLRTTANELAARPGAHRRALQRLRGVLGGLCESRVAAEDYANAQDYLALAAELTPAEEAAEKLELLEKLGGTALLAADAASNSETERTCLARAGQAFEGAAALAGAEPERQGGLLWSAAQSYDQAGEVAGVERTLLRFLDSRPADARWPRAYLELGQAYESQGQFTEALRWYSRLRLQFPTLEEAFRAAFRSAECLIACGRDDEAEPLLMGLLENDAIAPQALVFHDALLQLCELLYQGGRYADAIGRLEDFIALYPGDPEISRAQFLRADAYRRSAYRLTETAGPGSEGQRAQAAAQDRFRLAAEQFANLETELASATERDDAAELYWRLALIYSADCLFELNEPQALERALAVYQRAAVAFEQEPLALTAQVQIANIYLRMGRLPDAGRAVERARWLLRSMPASAFAAQPGAQRQDWERYLAAVSSSRLFESILAGRP